MKSNLVRIVVWGAVAVAVAVVFYIRYAKIKVNRLANEANVLIQDGDAKEKEVELGSEAGQLLNGTIPREFFAKSAKPKPTAPKPTKGEDNLDGPARKDGLVLDQAKLEQAVAKADEALKNIAETYRAAAAKFDAAAKVSKDNMVSEYFDLMSRAYQNRAAAKDTRRKAVTLLLDNSIHSEAERHQKQTALFEESRKAEGEFELLEEQAHKLHEDNQSKFN